MQYFIYEPTKDKLIYIVNRDTKPFSGSIDTAIHMAGYVMVTRFDCQYYIDLQLVSAVVLRTPHSTYTVTSSLAGGAFLKIKPRLIYADQLVDCYVVDTDWWRKSVKPAVGADGGLGEQVIAFFAGTLPGNSSLLERSVICVCV